MIPSVLAAQLQTGVEDFLKTTFPVSTQFFHGIIDRLLTKEEGVFKGPFLSMQLPFQMGDGSMVKSALDSFLIALPAF
ncbi:MAG: hypothetical protein B6I22_09925 [Desulfobacteraceae bacterium 4572_123]|nr:MAG: hypothetical protein B6I22_09925 [Desulfobacteraceae bacterium 4572_123]